MQDVDMAVWNPRFHGDGAVVLTMWQQHQHPNTSVGVSNVPPKLHIMT